MGGTEGGIKGGVRGLHVGTERDLQYLAGKGTRQETGRTKSKKETLGSLSAVRTGLEPVTSCVTGRHSNQAELTHLGSFAVAKV